MQPLTKEHKGTIYAILAGLSFGLIGYFSMTLLKMGFSVPNATFWRFFVGTLCIAAVDIVSNMLGERKNTSNFKEYFKLLIYGFIFCATSSMALVVASKYIDTGPAMVIFFTFPLFVLLINKIFFKVQISIVQYIALFMTLVGLALLINLKEFTADIVGIAVGVISAILYAFYIVSSKSSKLHPIHSTLMICLGATVGSAVWAFLDGSLMLPTDSTIWIICFFYGSLTTAVPFLLMLYSLQTISSDKVAILSVLEPVAVIIAGITLLGETITMYQAIGITLMLSAAIITALNPK